MRIGDYELLKKTGTENAMSIYAGRRLSDGVAVTISVLSDQHMFDDMLRKRIVREYEAATSVQSNHILQYLDLIDTDDVVAIVTEEVPSVNLRAMLSLYDGLSLKVMIEIFRQVAIGLHACHSAGVIHRNLTPENIYLTRDKTVKIANFGLSSILNATTLTMTGTMIGSPEYSPPENLYSAPRDVRGDIYSLGIIMWELFTGHNPYAGESLTDIFKKKKDSALPNPSGFNPNISKWLDLLIADMTEADPNSRIMSLQQVIVSLEKKKYTKPNESSDSKGRCFACGFNVPSVLWFCPYCGQSISQGNNAQETSVLLITGVEDADATQAFLEKTLAQDIEIGSFRNRKEVPVVENLADAECIWLKEELNKIGCVAEQRPMSAWYYKVSALIIFLLCMIPIILFRPPPESAAGSSVGLKIFFSIVLGGMACYYCRIHYATFFQIPRIFIAGALTSDPFSRYMSFANRYLSAAVMIFVTIIMFLWAANLLLSVFNFMWISGMFAFSKMIGNNNFLLLIAQLTIIKIVIGDIYTHPAFKLEGVNPENRDKMYQRADYQLLERFRKLAQSIPADDFRALTAQSIEQLIQFSSLKNKGAGLLGGMMQELEETFISAIELVIGLGEHTKILAEESSDKFRRRVEEKEYRLKKHVGQMGGDASKPIMEEWARTQDMKMRHEAAIEGMAQQLNTIRLIVGSMRAVVIQILTANDANVDRDQDLSLSMGILSGALKAVLLNDNRKISQ